MIGTSALGRCPSSQTCAYCLRKEEVERVARRTQIASIGPKESFCADGWVQASARTGWVLAARLGPGAKTLPPGAWCNAERVAEVVAQGDYRSESGQDGNALDGLIGLLKQAL